MSRGEHKGYLTVFMALCLPVLLTLFLTVIEGARMNAIRLRSEIAADTAMQSVLAEFHQELYKQYDLFFVDTSYGTSQPSLAKTEDHLRTYLDGNFSTVGLHLFGSHVDFQNLRASDVHITGARFASDDGGKAVREQIYAYMAADPAGAVVSDIVNQIDVFEGIGRDITYWETAWEENEAALHEVPSVVEEHEDGTVEEIKLENPAEEVTGFRLRPALLQVFGTTQWISEARVDSGTLLSHRELSHGMGVKPDSSHEYPEADALLLDEYILEKCGTYRNKMEKNRLKYQAEYILFGKDSDEANLEKMAARLLLIRNAANCAYIFSDRVKCAEADVVAAGVAFLVLQPEIQPLVKNAILFGWAYLESVLDVRSLFQGGSVPFLKTKGTWKTSLSSIFSPGGLSGEKKEGGMFTYETYLRALLYMENIRTKTWRLMDMMEADIRQTKGNEGFRMDACFDTFAMEGTIASSFGYTCGVKGAKTYN